MSYKSANVEDQYKKDPLLKKADVQSLQDWASKQPHLPKVTELQTIQFLHSCYYSNEAAKTTLDTYFTVKTLCADIFGNRNPNQPSIQTALDVTLVTPLPILTPEGYHVIFTKVIDTNADRFNYNNTIKMLDMSIMSHLNLSGTCNGIVMVIDLEGFSFGHLTKLSVVTVKKFLFYLQEAMPIRLKGFNFINPVSFMDKILALMKPFMKKELADMLAIHSDLNSFYKCVPQECMPQEFGGKCDSIPVLHNKIKQLFADNATYFQEEEKQVVDESKRPGKPKNVGDFFGIEGTFKKLEVD